MKYTKALLLLFIFFAAFSVPAEELQPTFTGKHLGAIFTGISWPATLHKDFQSGFENRILIRVSLLSDSASLMRSDILITEKYDLWDELFTVSLHIGDKEKATKTFVHVNDAIAYATTLKLTDVLTPIDVSRTKVLMLQADVLINPVEREKIERVTQWVAENSTPKTPSPTGGNAPLTARPNSLFNSIYGQYMRGADMVAPWKVTITSKPFVLATLQKDAHSDEEK